MSSRLLAVAVVAVSGCFSPPPEPPQPEASPFFEPGEEFWAAVTQPKELDRGWEGSAIYRGRSAPGPNGRESLVFERADDGQPLALDWQGRGERHVALEVGRLYEVFVFVNAGWPSTFALMILDDEGLVLQGLTDWGIDATIRLGSQARLVRTPLAVREKRVLEDRFRGPGRCYERVTNTEVEFRLGENVLELHQGESGRLGVHNVRLAVARKMEWPAEARCLDAGINGISYVVWRSDRGDRGAR